MNRTKVEKKHEVFNSWGVSILVLLDESHEAYMLTLPRVYTGVSILVLLDESHEAVIDIKES